MDLNVGSTLQPLVKNDGWFTNKQVNWYRDKSEKFSKVNGGKSYPALAFFHMSLPEYELAWKIKKTNG